MAEEYDQITADHYNAFRPELHSTILKKCISINETFALGLDIGCGTGQSAHALLNFCESVVAIEPSEAMLENVLQHPKIEYLFYNTKNLEFDKDSFDIVTFAGSLFYGKSQHLLDDVIRVCQNQAAIVVYDFEILLENVLLKLGFKSSQKGTYNHETDFSGLQAESLDHISRGIEKTNFGITLSNLAHIILSVKEQYIFFSDKFESENIHKTLVEKLQETFPEKELELEANIFFNRYRVLK